MLPKEQDLPYKNQQKTNDITLQNLKNKKIYFDSDGTQIKIGYDDTTGIGFVEISSE